MSLKETVNGEMVKEHQTDLGELWKGAMPLKDARLHFAPGALAKRLAELPEAKLTDMFNDAAKISDQPNAEFLKTLALFTEKAAGRNTERSAILLKMSESFIDLLRRRELRCFAFEVPRKLSSAPVEILPEHWTAYPDWDKGEFRASGIHLIELRVSPVVPGAPLVLPRTSTKLGRPTVRPQILAAFHSLKRENGLNSQMRVKFIVGLVRQRLATLFPDLCVTDTSPSNEAIRLAISGFLRSDKEQ